MLNFAPPSEIVRTLFERKKENLSSESKIEIVNIMICKIPYTYKLVL